MSESDFGRRLASLREAAGLTAYALAKRSGVTQSFIGKLERGEKGPSWATVLKLAAALGVGVSAFEREGGR